MKINIRGSLHQTCLLAAVLLALPATMQAQDYIYETNNGAITITGYTGPGGDVTITATINDLPVTSIGDYAFEGCTSLTVINVDAANLAYSSVVGVLFDKSQTTLIQYPAGKAGSYIIPNTVISIAGQAFAGCGLTSVKIPDSITTIGDYAFEVCHRLTSVTIGSGITSIGSYAFDECISLTNVTIPQQRFHHRGRRV